MHRHHARIITSIFTAGLVIALSFGVREPASAAVSNWQKGVTILSGSSTDFSTSAFKQSVKNAAALGVNYIILQVPIYQSNVGSTDIQTGWNTPTDQTLTDAAAYVHSLGLHVGLKFHLMPYDGQWSAYINPADRTAWFTNYGTMITHYAALAQTDGIEEFCIGTELISMSSANVNSTNTSNWVALIGRIRSVYSGALTYSANWGQSGFSDEKSNIQFWGSLDYIGISAYYNLSGDGSVASLVQSWGSWAANDIAPFQKKWDKPVLFTEIGYKAITDSYTHPWMWWESGGVDENQQANDYQALFQYWNGQTYLQGVDIWNWYSDPNAGGAGNNDYTPQNKLASNVMQQWFGAATPPPPPTPPPTPTPPPAGNPKFTSSAAATPSAPSAGQSTTISATVTDSGDPSSGTNVDVEIDNSAGAQLLQKIFSGQNFASNGDLTYSFSWTPPSSGTYTVKVGIFDGNWTLYNWNNAAATIAAGGAGTPPPASSTVNIWWPANGSTVSGVQPFKAMLTNASIDSYSMYWQVDNGSLNPMTTNLTDYPHKEALVDVGPWTWNSNGQYKLNFVAEDLSGHPLGNTMVAITVVH